MMSKSLLFNLFKGLGIAIGVLLTVNVVSAQQQITVQVSPTISNPIGGELLLDRSKYFNLATNCSRLSNKLEPAMFDAYIKAREMTVGRSLGMISAELSWGNSIREDPNRPGHIDTAYMANQLNPNDNGLDEFIDVFGGRSGVVNHDRNGSYPGFMETYTLDGGSSSYPVNNDAHAELAAHLMKHKYTDFQRPIYYELVNEPHYQYWGDRRFHEFHTKTKSMFTAMNIPTEVGGPCYSVGNFYKHNFKNLSQITNFIDHTDNQLDFYSFHIYDYMRWSDTEGDFIGAVSTGLPEEAVFDAIAAHTYHKYGKAFTFVGSEHGGYLPDQANRTYALDMLADRYFPGSGFLHEMEKRAIDNFVMVNSAIANTMMFMNHPHIVKKAVPFILLESSGWDPHYYSSLLVKENFDKNSNIWHEAKLIHFYDFFKDVKGRRVQSRCDDADIQQLSFVDGPRLIMLFHNQSDTPGRVDVNLNQHGMSVRDMSIRRVGRAEDFRPYHTETNLPSLAGIEINGQESMAIFVRFNASITEESVVNEIPFYGTQFGQTFAGSRDFTVNLPDYEKVQFATLRVGIGRQSAAASAKHIDISLNGTPLDIPIEDCADRLTSKGKNPWDDNYATTRMIDIDPALLQAKNTVTVNFTDGNEGGVGAVVIRAGIPVTDNGVPRPPTGLRIHGL